jgi:glycosyltransferase involved in cell wall biosynthesis
VIHISNALLLGVGNRLRAVLDVPLLCSLQDEDVWIDAMGTPYAERCWDALREQAACVDGFVAVSRYFSDVMCARLKLDHHRLHVMHVGFDATDIEPAPLSFKPPVIGYLSRMCRDQGLDVLVDAFLLLWGRGTLPNLKLRISGGKTTDDDAFFEGIRAEIDAAGAANAVEIVSEFDREHRKRFLASLSVFSVPARKGGAYGTYLLEAMAAGVPVVQPCVGAFPEIVRDTGGGVLYEPNTADRLAKALESVLLDQAHAQVLGKRGRAAILGDFSVEKMVQNLVRIYEGILEDSA